MSSFDLAQLPDDLRAQLLDPVTHSFALALWMGRALREGDDHAAFMIADRRCRILPRLEAGDHLLRAEAAWRLGEQETAVTELYRALELDPTHQAVNCQALAWLKGADACRAARSLIGLPGVGIETLATAIACLVKHEEAVVASFEQRGVDSMVDGWATWPAAARLMCHVQGQVGDPFEIIPDPTHPLATLGRSAAACQLARLSDDEIKIDLYCAEQPETAIVVVVPARLRSLTTSPIDPHAAGYVRTQKTASPRALSVLVPVYGDYDATIACLDSLAQQDMGELRWTSIVVDDATPDPRIAADLRSRAAAGEIELIVHNRNRGFAASINAAADRALTGDLLLLNADTLLPPDALRRLVQVGSAAGVGTVTPLSNNGEASSFPKRDVFNALPSLAELITWDQAARAAATADRMIDLPNGVGFCLLVRRDCWDAVGGMSAAYGRGYYEDVDLCLRAHELGFRNLCALNVVVGHAGSLSFGGEKRALVVRNLATLEARHPHYRKRYAAFQHADPLRRPYGEIERALKPPPHQVLLVGALPHRLGALTARAEALASEGLRCLAATPERNSSQLELGLRSLCGSVPQSIRFHLREDEPTVLIRYLKSMGIARIEIIDPVYCPDVLLHTLEALDRPITLHLSGPVPQAGRAPARWLARLHESGDRVLCADEMTFAAAAEFLAEARLDAPHRLPRLSATACASHKRKHGHGCLAILSPRPRADVSRIVAELSRRTHSKLTLHVFGTTLNDLSLMAANSVFVSGALALTDLPKVLLRLDPDAFFLIDRTSSFRWYEIACSVLAKPGAYFDWSYGRYRSEDRDLVLDPAVSDSDAADRIVAWFAKRCAKTMALPAQPLQKPVRPVVHEEISSDRLRLMGDSQA